MQEKVTRFEKFLLYFTFVDILFAPYMLVLATTYSQFFVLGWFFVKKEKKIISKEVKYYYYILVFILIGCFISLFTIPYDVDYYFIDNIKRGLNLWMGLSYYFFFYHIFKSTDESIRKWLVAVVVYITLWGVLYYMSSEYFFNLKNVFSPHDAMLADKDMGFFRFNFIWTDPNNVGYALVGVLSFLIIDKKVNNILLMGLILMSLFCMMLLMSGGTLIVAAVVLSISLIIRIIKVKSMFDFVSLVILILVSIYLFLYHSDVLINSEVGEAFQNRMESKIEHGDTRGEIYLNLLDSKNILLYLFIGEGSNIFVGDERYSPHNGHLMFIFAFGMICYIVYMLLVFRKAKSTLWIDYLPIVAFLVGFTVNIGIGELKFAAILYMLVAFIRVRSKKLSISK